MARPRSVSLLLFLACLFGTTVRGFAFRSMSLSSVIPIHDEIGPWTTSTTFSSARQHARPASPSSSPLSRNHVFKRPNGYHRSSSTQLSALPPFLSISSPVGSLAILAFIVLIHESGHYLAAKSFGVKVEEFSVGFGPKIFGFRFQGDEFNLRAIPLGGYVKFPENYNTTLAQEIQRAEYQAADEYLKTREVGLGTKIVNAALLGALSDKAWKEEKERRKQLLKQSVPTSAQRQPWWQFRLKQKPQVAANTIGTTSFPEIEYYDDPDLLQNRPWQQRAVVLSMGVIFNLLLAFFIYLGQVSIGPGIPIPKFDSGIVVSAMPSPDAAASGILRKGDIIVGVNGQPIMTATRSPSALDSQKAINSIIEKIRETPDGQALRFSIVHDNQIEEEVQIQPKRREVNGPQSIGVLLSPNFVKTQLLKTEDPIKAADIALRCTVTLTQETANGLAMFFKSLVAGAPVNSQVTGPIGLIKSGSEVVATQDWTAILLFAAAISINLGVINSVPLPALDGGQLVFVLAEAIIGRKVDQQVQENITGVAVLFLILLSVSTFFGDVSTIMLGR
jgi:membrane-associated protease RseP (regulator of RpoE activity)